MDAQHHHHWVLHSQCMFSQLSNESLDALCAGKKGFAAPCRRLLLGCWALTGPALLWSPPLGRCCCWPLGLGPCAAAHNCCAPPRLRRAVCSAMRQRRLLLCLLCWWLRWRLPLLAHLPVASAGVGCSGGGRSATCDSCSSGPGARHGLSGAAAGLGAGVMGPLSAAHSSASCNEQCV